MMSSSNLASEKVVQPDSFLRTRGSACSSSIRVQQDGSLVFDRLPELERGLVLDSSPHAQHPPSLTHIRTAAPVDYDTLYCLLSLENIPARPADKSDAATAQQLLSFLKQLDIANAVDWIARPVGLLGDHAALVYLRSRFVGLSLMQSRQQRASNLGWNLQFWTGAELDRVNAALRTFRPRAHLCARGSTGG
jgi:hypothetical protein